MRALGSHPFTQLFVIVLVFRRHAFAAAVAMTATLLGIRTANTLLSSLLCANEIKDRRTNDKYDGGDCDVINNSHIMPSERIPPSTACSF